MTPQVLTESRGAVRVVRLARAEKKNAFTIAMYEAFTEALTAAEADASVGAVVVLGAPGAFSAGNDIVDFLERPPTGEDSAVFRLLRVLAGYDKPLVAGVDGVAVGIGTTMLLHCDLVVASTRARFALPFVRLGLVPEGGSTALLPALVGRQRASEWLLLGDVIEPEEARAAGLLNRVVAPEELEPTALGLAERIAAQPREAVQRSRALLRQGWETTAREAIAREGKVFLERLASAETQATLRTFTQKGK